MKKTKFVLIVLGVMLGLLAINMLLPTKIQNPVEGCGKESYHPKSFWHPWGDHHHRGVDIFAKKGTPVHPAIGGIVISTTYNLGAGGNTVAEYHMGVCGYFPAEAPKYSIIVSLNKIGLPASAGGMAGVLFHDIVEWMATHDRPTVLYVDENTNDTIKVTKDYKKLVLNNEISSIMFHINQINS